MTRLIEILTELETIAVHGVIVQDLGLVLGERFLDALDQVLTGLRPRILRVRRARERDKQPELAYLKVKDRQRLGPEDHALLRALAEWREREAMARDRPRRHVIADNALVQIAQSRPTSPAATSGCNGRIAAVG